MENPFRFLPPEPVSQEPERTAEVEATDLRHLYAKKLREGNVGAFIKTMFSDPGLRAQFDEIHADRRNILSGIDSEMTAEKISSVVVSIMRHEKLRELFLASVSHDFFDRTRELKEAITDSMERMESGEALDEKMQSALVFDEVVIGGGIQGSIYNSRRTSANPHIKSLTIEAGGAISGNFSNKGMVRINTEVTRHQTNEMPHFSEQTGNLNFFGKNAPVQLSYIEVERYPSANNFADVATANQFLSTSDILMQTKVRRV